MRIWVCTTRSREEEIFARVDSYNEGPLYNENLREIYATILEDHEGDAVRMSEAKIAPIPDLGQRTDEITIYAGPVLGGVGRAVRGSGRVRGGSWACTGFAAARSSRARTRIRFQGLGEEALKIMKAAGDKYDLKTLTEVMDSAHCELVSDSMWTACRWARATSRTSAC